MPDAPAINQHEHGAHANTHIGTHIDAPRHFLCRWRLDQRACARPHRDARGRGARCQPQARGRRRQRRRSGADRRQVRRPARSPSSRRCGPTAPSANRSSGTTPSISSRASANGSSGRGVSAVAMDCFPEKPFWLMTLTAGRARRQPQALAQGRHSDDPDAHQPRQHRRPTFTLVALPLKLQGMDGAPARVIGIED